MNDINIAALGQIELRTAPAGMLDVTAPAPLRSRE